MEQEWLWRETRKRDENVTNAPRVLHHYNFANFRQIFRNGYKSQNLTCQVNNIYLLNMAKYCLEGGSISPVTLQLAKDIA